MLTIIDNLNDSSKEISTYKLVNFYIDSMFLRIHNISEVWAVKKVLDYR